MNVFTYGSLMYPQVWDRVVRGRYRGAAALLRGFRRCALRGLAYPGAVPDPGAQVVGRVYFDVDPDDLARLDAFEASEYRREAVIVSLPDAPAAACVPAQLYVYLDSSRLEAQDWDAQRFEREQLAGFVASHTGADRA
jgi:gamma-glutamylcyclotransferase (GGCT)/AIG2-like uncharacterized protein YtfP